MKTRTIANIMATIAIGLLVLELVLFYNLCKSTNGVIDITSNMALFVSLGCAAGATIIMDIILAIFMGLNKYKSVNNYTVISLIGSGFISIFVIFMLFSI